MKLYTRTGDDGETGLFGGGRVSKAHRRVEAYGTVDELNAALGVSAAAVGGGQVREWLVRIQGDLFGLGANLATPGPKGDEGKPSTPPLPGPRVQEMEAFVDTITAEVGELRSFILPGGSPGAAALHLARTVCRRAERAVVRLAGEEVVDPEILRYLNRLSDLLFAMARLENFRQGKKDIPWKSDSP